MRKLLSLILACALFLSFATAARAEGMIGLSTCRDVPAFQQRADDSLAAIEGKLLAAPAGSPQLAIYERKLDQTAKRFDRYSTMLCGEEGLPRLITDGRLNHAGDFLIPGLAFLYIAGWLGWAGRMYLIAARNSGEAELKESTIDVPLALKCFAGALAWPAAALAEIASGQIRETEEAVPISPR